MKSSRPCRGGGLGVAPPPGVREKRSPLAKLWLSSLCSSGAEQDGRDARATKAHFHERHREF